MKEFEKILLLSEKLRKGYKGSLEEVDVNYKSKWLEHFEIMPLFFEEIYSVCDGTKYDIQSQEFFDFLPGYRLMQIDEILDTYEKKFKDYDEDGIIIPFLADYSGSYYMYAVIEGQESILLLVDGVLELIYSSTEKFWETIEAFYNENVYFLDEDGYLSYDYEKEGEIGRKYNSGIGYWE